LLQINQQRQIKAKFMPYFIFFDEMDEFAADAKKQNAIKLINVGFQKTND